VASVTQSQIDDILREKLRQHSVSYAVKDVELLSTPERVLAEVIVQDASVLEETGRAVQDAERELESQGVSLVADVRALWEVEEVERVAIANPSGAPAGLIAAVFKATLKSGARQQEVWISVTPSAQNVLRPLIASDEALRDLVRVFLRRWLAIGGPGSWDPTRDQKLELDESAARYLRWGPYEQLKGSVDVVFRSVDSARGFLQQVFVLAKQARYFNDVLMELPGPGGAYARGERLPTSNYELYEMLLDSEKDELRQYYSQRLEKAEKDWPELKEQFPNVWS
jgi:hypothetical protein